MKYKRITYNYRAFYCALRNILQFCATNTINNEDHRSKKFQALHHRRHQH